MYNTGTEQSIAGVSNDAVLNATGKDWGAWFVVLDRINAAKKPHRVIARYLHTEEGLSGWWSQMVTVGYEQVRGRRVRHQKGAYFEISKGKTIHAPIESVFKAWADEALREYWLPGQSIYIRKASPVKSMRVTWSDERTGLNVYFYPIAENKTKISVQHVKLTDAEEAEEMKIFWGDSLVALKDFLETLA